ncbi:MAG: helix-turn-helix transcriptional regulator [Patescibacteria group bacterium]
MNSANEYIRICWLHNQLKSARLLKKDYLEKFEVSERTFQRDLDRLRDQLNGPVAYQDGYYCYTEENYELPLLLLNEQELFGLLVTSAFTEQYRDTPMFEALKKILEKLAVQLGTDVSYVYRGEGSGITGASVGTRSFTWEHLQTLLQAIYKKMILSITYHSFNSGKISERRVLPVHIYNYEGEFYLVAWCYTREAFRDFFIGRIQEIVVKDEHDKKLQFDFTSYFSEKHWGILKGGTTEHIRFKIPVQTELRLQEKYGSQVKRVEEREGWAYYTCTVGVTNDFLNWAVEFDKGMVVLEPEHVRKKIIEHCRSVLQTYEGCANMDCCSGACRSECNHENGDTHAHKCDCNRKKHH